MVRKTVGFKPYQSDNEQIKKISFIFIYKVSSRHKQNDKYKRFLFIVENKNDVINSSYFYQNRHIKSGVF